MTLCAPLAHADELQDINGLLSQGRGSTQGARGVNQYLAQKPGEPNGRSSKA